MRRGLNKNTLGAPKGRWFGEQRRSSFEGNFLPKGSGQRCRRNRGEVSSRRRVCHIVSDYAEVSKRRTLGSNIKITFTGAF